MPCVVNICFFLVKFSAERGIYSVQISVPEATKIRHYFFWKHTAFVNFPLQAMHVLRRSVGLSPPQTVLSLILLPSGVFVLVFISKSLAFNKWK